MLLTAPDEVMSSTPSNVFSRIWELLGLTPPASPPSLEVLLRRTRRQLLEVSRYLGLTGIHSLKKAALAGRFLEALQELIGLADTGPPEPIDRPRKFDLGQPTGNAAETENIPWGYGQDRVTAMIVDPERLYV